MISMCEPPLSVLFAGRTACLIQSTHIIMLRVLKYVVSAILTWPGVFPVCHRALRRCSPGPVVEFTTLMERPE